MPAWTFSAGVAVTVSSVGDAGPGLDDQVTFAVDVAATVWADPAGTVPVTVTTLGGAPGQVYAGSRSLFSPFGTDTDLPSGGVWLNWGADLPLQFVPSNEVLNALPQALAALAEAQSAKVAAQAAQAAAESALAGGGGGTGGGAPAYYLTNDPAAVGNSSDGQLVLLRIGG